ncbi:MAG: FHIPEP family type III secretion protein [Treponema sp.]|nr:FHIPEP family type III secretion protein [Treponema sp.]
MLQVTRPHIYEEDIPLFIDRPLDQIKLEIGYGLITLCKDKTKDGLIPQLTELRERLFEDYGLSVPLIHIQDNAELQPYEYRILLKGVEKGRFQLKPGYILAIPFNEDIPEYTDSTYEKTKEPSFSMNAYFVPENESIKFKDQGFVCITAAKIISKHIHTLIEINKTEILNQSMVRRLVNNVRVKNSDVVSDVFFKNSFSISNMKTLLNLLLEENVPIHDMETILEGIADNLKELKKPYELVEKVREKLAFSIVNKLSDENKCLHVIKVATELSDFFYENTIEPSLENDIPCICIESLKRRKVLTKAAELSSKMIEKGFAPVFLCIQPIRLGLFDFLQDKISGCICLSAEELKIVAKEIQVVVEEELSLDEE